MYMHMHVYNFKRTDTLSRNVQYNQETGNGGGLREGEKKQEWDRDLSFHCILSYTFQILYHRHLLHNQVKNKVIHFFTFFFF